MTRRAPRICACGRVVAYGVKCACQMQRDKERKQAFDQRRPTASQRGYTSSKWTPYRDAFLKRHPVCCHCPAPSTVVDHWQPHKGDKALFWDKANHVPLCTSCHSGWKQSLEKSGRVLPQPPSFA